jgi:Ca-activated chloride channel family protein
MYVESLSPDSVSSQGTDFSKALAEAQSAFERGGTNTDEKTAITKAIVIVSDGEDNEAGANEMAEKIKDSGIRIFTLAVGTEKGGAIPVRDRVGNVQGYRRDKSGQVILTQTKGTVLKDLAKQGGGSFYHLNYAVDTMAQLRSDLTKLEKAEFDSAVVVDYKEGFQIWLFLGILLAFIELLINERSPLGRVWKGRFEVAEK